MRNATVLISLITFLSVASATASVIHVPADQPTIQQAINVAQNGDTVLVSPGTYQERINFLGKNIIVVSQSGPGSTIIDGGGLGTTVIIDRNVGLEAELLGFTVTDGAGIGIADASPTINGNIFYNIRGSAINGMSSSAYIRGNLFYGNTCDTQLFAALIDFANNSSPVIVDNILHDNDCATLTYTPAAGFKLTFVNNTLVRNRIGIEADGQVGGSQQVYENNIIAENQIGLDVVTGANIPTWKNNLVFNNGTNYSGIPDQTGLLGNASFDPLFLSSPRNDFHLQYGSPAIDAGDNSAPGVPPKDYNGSPRVQNGIVDIGAYEFFPAAVAFTSSLSFSNQLLGTTSGTRSVTVNNPGSTSLFLDAVPTGDFAETDNCNKRVPAGDSCTIKVAFKPTTIGTRTGLLTLRDNAPGSPQAVTLIGVGTEVSLSPAALTYPPIVVDTTSNYQSATIQNHGTSTMTISSISIAGTNAGDFFISYRTCGSSLATNASCVVHVRFRPLAVGSRLAVLKVSDDGGGSPQQVKLSGTGVAASASEPSRAF